MGRSRDHVLDYLDRRFVCLRCGARRLNIMPFKAFPCPGKTTPAVDPVGDEGGAK